MKTIITLTVALFINTCIVKAQTNPSADERQPVQSNPLYKGGNAKPQAAEVKAENPLYQGGGTSGNNPLYQGRAAVADGQPIGGIVVKGGHNANAIAQADGNPIGGIIVKGAKQQNQQTDLSNPIPSIGVVVKQ